MTTTNPKHKQDPFKVRSRSLTRNRMAKALDLNTTDNDFTVGEDTMGLKKSATTEPNSKIQGSAPLTKTQDASQPAPNGKKNAKTAYEGAAIKGKGKGGRKKKIKSIKDLRERVKMLG